MHLSQLFIFSKNTDATETIRGYKFQELKTLETWLYNKVHKIDEKIYCDYENDIFQRDLRNYKSKFRQIKLYTSKTFSFTSEEIQNSITHFFMLFVKGDYLFDEVNFVFETNTGIAREYSGNDATLLKQWVESEKPLKKELQDQCREKVKEIIIDELRRRASAVKSAGELKDQADQAMKLLDDLNDEFWDNFIGSIEWQFSTKPADEELSRVVDSVNNLISQLPFPISQQDSGVIFSALYAEVGKISMVMNPENRYVDGALMDHILLRLGDDEEKSYGEVFEVWKDVGQLRRFSVGEFYEVLHAAKTCRRKKFLADHSIIWANLLAQYIVLSEVPPQCKRDAIYESVWVTLRPSLDERTVGSLKGLEPIIEEYFHDFENFNSYYELSDAQNLLTIVYTSQKLGLLNIDTSMVADWQARFTDFLNNQLTESKTSETRCRLLEISAFHKLNQLSWRQGTHTLADVIIEFERIIPLLADAPLYPISQLSEKIEGLFPAYIIAKKTEVITKLESFLEGIEPLVSEREGNFSLAKKYVKRGVGYLNTTDPKGLLKALDYFHKAKELYYEDKVIEGFVLSLVNIAQFYLASGLNFAAKYYGLLAAWKCFNDGNTKLYERISKSLIFVHLADYKEGAWLTSIQSFFTYLRTRMEFDTAELDMEEDKMFRESVLMLTTAITLLPVLAPDTEKLVEELKKKLGWFHEQYVREMEEALQNGMSQEKAITILKGKTTGVPLNDLGRLRQVGWKALGIEWSIEFPNDYINTSLTEEFSALLQIFHAETALADANFNYKVKKVTIVVSKSELILPPEIKLENPDELKSKIYLQILDSVDPNVIKFHYASMTSSIVSMFGAISGLSPAEFQKQWVKLLADQNLSGKGLTIAAYQKVFRELMQKDTFDDYNRETFSKPDIQRKLPNLRGLN